MDDRHVLRIVNELSSYLSLLNRHISDMEGVTDEATLREHYGEIDALIDKQTDVLNNLGMYMEVIASRLDMYNDSYKDLVARRRTDGVDAINNDPYTSTILENYKRVPELEQILKMFSDYKHTIDDTVAKWNGNKSLDTLKEIADTTHNVFDDMNAARERYGYVAVDIKDEGQFRRVKVESQGRKVAVNVPVEHFNGGTVNRVIEGAIAASEAKNDHIVSMMLPNGEVISGKFSELSQLAANRLDKIPKDDYIKPEPEVTTPPPVVEETPAPVVPETPVVEPEVVGKHAPKGDAPVAEPTVEPETIGKHAPKGDAPVVAPIVEPETVGKHAPKGDAPVAEPVEEETRRRRRRGKHEGPETIKPAEGPVTAEDVKNAVDAMAGEEPADILDPRVLGEELKKLNPDVEFEADYDNNRIFASVPGDKLVLPGGFYYNDKNGITNKHNTKSGAYIALDVNDLAFKRAVDAATAEAPAAPGTPETGERVTPPVPEHDRSEDIAGDNIVEINPEDATVEAELEREEREKAEEHGEKPLKVIKSRVSKIKHKKLIIAGLATLGFGITPLNVVAAVAAGFFIYYAAHDGIQAIKDAHPIKALQEWAVSRKIGKIVDSYEDLDFVIDENGPRIEDHGVESPTDEDIDQINDELARALKDEDADWKDLPGIYTRRELEVPKCEKNKLRYKIGEKLSSFFAPREDEMEDEIVNGDGSIDPIVEDEAVVEPVTHEPTVAPAAPVAPVPPVAPVVDAEPIVAEPIVAEQPKKKLSFGERLKGFFGIGKNVDEPEVIVNNDGALDPIVADAPVAEPTVEPVTRPIPVVEPVAPVVTPDVVVDEPEIEPMSGTMDRGADVIRNYSDSVLLQAANIINNAGDFDSVREMISGLFGGLVPGSADMTTGFTPGDLDFLYANIFDEFKFQDLQEYLNSNGFIIDESVIKNERGVSRI